MNVLEGMKFMLIDMSDAYDMSDVHDMHVVYECFSMHEWIHCLDMWTGLVIPLSSLIWCWSTYAEALS